MMLISRQLIYRGGFGWRLRRQPNPPPERISQIPVIASPPAGGEAICCFTQTVIKLLIKK